MPHSTAVTQPEWLAGLKEILDTCLHAPSTFAFPGVTQGLDCVPKMIMCAA